MAAPSKKLSASRSASAAPKAVSKVVSTVVRNSALPPRKTAAAIVPARKIVTREQIAIRAFEIHLSNAGGTETDNWLLAEKQLGGL